MSRTDLPSKAEVVIVVVGVVGYLTSGMYGHAVGSAIGMGYVEVPGVTRAMLDDADIEIEVALERCSARASLKGLYDPDHRNMKN